MTIRSVTNMMEAHRTISRLLIFLFVLIVPTSQSECGVSEWTEWSECFGGCREGQVVRNRDVVKPPLPEPGQRKGQQLCPHLYEVKYCPKIGCLDIEQDEEQGRLAKPIVKSLVEKQMELLGITSSMMKNKELRERLINDTENLLHVEDLIQNPKLLPVAGPPNDITTEPRRKMSHRSTAPSFRDLPTSDSKSIETTVTPISGETSKEKIAGNFVRKSSRRRRVYPKSTEKSLEVNGVSKSDVMEKKVYNKKKIELLKKPSTNETEKTENITTTLSPTTTTTETVQYWKRGNGYVPNTKEHAYDITSQLYMTRSMIQSLADDPLPLDEAASKCWGNKRCCKVSRTVCSDGSTPKMIKRWYRPEGSNICVAYHYPKCGEMEEKEEVPILFAPNCQDICFKGPEKKIAPLFNIDYDME